MRKCERCGERMPFLALRSRLADGRLVCATCFHAANDKCVYCDLDIFLTADDVKPMWVHTLTGNAKGVEGHAAAPYDEKVASSFMDRMGPSKPWDPEAYKSQEPELLNLVWSYVSGTEGDEDDPPLYKGEWWFKDYNGDRQHAHEILISKDEHSDYMPEWSWNAVFHNNWPGGPDLSEGFRDLGEKSGTAPTLDRAKAESAAYIRDTWNKYVHLNENGAPEQLRMGLGSKQSNYPGLTESTAFYIADSTDAIIAGPYTLRDTAAWALSTGVYPEGSKVVEGPSYEDEAGWHTAPMGLREPAYASVVLTATKHGGSIQVVAHDSGDGQTIYHCPFCGSGNVVGRGDGTTECGYCHNAFTVQVQPQHPNMPQTNPMTGDPMKVPGMPGEIDRATPGGPLPPDPGQGEQPRPPESSGPPKPPGAGKGAPPPPGGDKPEEPGEKKPNPFEKGSAKIASVDDFQGKTVHVLRNSKYMGAWDNVEISPHDDEWYAIKDGNSGAQYFARAEDMFDSAEAAKAEASARRKPRGPKQVARPRGEWGNAMWLANPGFKTEAGHVLDEDGYVRHLAIKHAGPNEIGRVLARVRKEQEE